MIIYTSMVHFNKIIYTLFTYEINTKIIKIVEKENQKTYDVCMWGGGRDDLSIQF